MAPLEAVEKSVERTTAYTKFHVSFNGIRKDRVPGFLYVPNDDAKKHPAVLLQYGSGGNKNTNYIVALGQQFVGKGFVVERKVRGHTAAAATQLVDGTVPRDAQEPGPKTRILGAVLVGFVPDGQKNFLR